MNRGSCIFPERQAMKALKDKKVLYNNDIWGSHSGACE